MKKREINITTGISNLHIQKKFISVEDLKICKFITRRKRYKSAGIRRRSLIGYDFEDIIF